MNEREAIEQLKLEATSLYGMLREGGKAAEFAEKRINALDVAIATLEKQVTKKV